MTQTLLIRFNNKNREFPAGGLLVIFLIAILFTFQGCKKAALSPARSIAGTWKSLVKVTVNETTNCNNSVLYNYATFQCYFTFVIEAIDDNDVTVSVYGSARSGLSDACGETPPIEDGYPVIYSGKISSSQLTLTDNVYALNSSGHVVYGAFDVGDFSFTTNQLTGKIFWLQYYSSLDAIGWTTEQISLTKQ